MRLLPGRAKPAESIISILLLAAVLLIAAGVFVKQSRYDPARFNLDLAAAASDSEESAASATNLALLLPRGFVTMTKIESYGPDTLYEKIDGKAGLYLDCGFKRLTCQRFAAEADKNLWAELYIYNMGTTKGAFAVYSAQRRAQAIPLEAVTFGYKTADAVFAAEGKFYVELLAATEAPDLLGAMANVARNFFKQAGTDRGQIAELELFPQANLVPHSFGLKIPGAFGFDGLKNTFTAQYKLGDEIITAFLSKRANPQEAEKIAESYYDFLINNGGVEKDMPLAGPPGRFGRAVDFYGTTEIVFATGSFVAGVHEAENEQHARELAAALFNKLADGDKQ